MPLLYQKASYATKVSSDPAANVEHALTFDEPMLVQSFVAALVTDANVANRQVHFTLEDAAGRVYARFTAGGTQAASLTRQYSGQVANFAAPAVADTNFVVPIGGGVQGLYVPQGGVLRTVTTLFQATDNWGVLTVSGERV